jgi:dTDP-glucose 4,6-dehydratase
MADSKMTNCKRVFLTGSEGFIGSHLTEALVKQGFEVTALAQYNSFNNHGWLSDLSDAVLSNVNIVMGDVRDSNQMRSLIKEADYILHLASLIAIPFSYQAPSSYVDTNISGTLNILQAARDFSVPVIHTSTSEVYGTAQYVPIDEVHPLQGQSPYSASKIGADQIAMSYFYSFDLPVKILRPFNTYGPRQSLRAVIPTIITQILRGETNVRLGATSPRRDFNYVEDTVEGFMCALKSPNGVGEVINIGSGFDISVGDTAVMIAEELKSTINLVSDDVRYRPENSEVQRLLADNRKARDLLSWEPAYGSVDGLRKGLQKTIKWFSQPENLSSYPSTDYVT